MAQSLFEYEAEFIKNLKSTTGKDFQEWLDLIEASKLTDKSAICNWLKKEFKIDYSPAYKLSNLFLEDQKLNAPKVLFSGNLRSGTVEYESKEGSFKMISEMGAYDVLAIIDVPTEDRWESVTNLPLEKRESILHYIGQKTVEKQTMGSGSYEIKSNCIKIKS
ncbi:MAG: DUF4287 domain-containing protein [Bacteroidetes bacterium]|nr:MAG: DUF4287 domain-containing protein [Bacteroidota bacterium]